MNVRQIQVFISATTYDLASARELVKQSLFDLGCTSAERPDFHPDHSETRRILTQKIASCDALVHLVGMCYGGEPTTPGLGERRRSYTQLEYDTARELGKPVFVFLCQPGFDYNPSHPEDPERQELQQQHRQEILASGHARVEVASSADLATRAGELRGFVDGLHREIARGRKRVLWSVAAAALLFGVMAPASFFLQERYGPGPWSRPAPRRSPVADQFTSEVLTELSRQGLARRPRAEAGSPLDYPGALRVVAERFHFTGAQTEVLVRQWGLAQRHSPDPSACGQAEFLFRNFPQAAVWFDQAAQEELRWAEHAFNKEAKLRAKAATDWQRAGEAFQANGQLGEALARFDLALTCVSRVASPQSWATLQNLRGLCLTELGLRVAGPSGQRDLDAAAGAYRAALRVWNRTQFPREWARVQEALGIALAAQAQRNAGAEAARLRRDAASAYRAALEVFTPNSSPQDHLRIARGLELVEPQAPARPPRAS